MKPIRLSDLFEPTEIGETVTITGYGAPIASWMCGCRGVVVRFTRAGNPVLRIWGSPVRGMRGVDEIEVTDRYGCAKVSNHETGRFYRAGDIASP